MWERVQKPELQTFMVEIKNAVGDFVENEIMKAIAAGDMTTARWYADRQLRDRGFGQFVAHVDETPPDPEHQAAVQRLIDAFANDMDRKYQAHLAAQQQRAPLVIDVKPNEPPGAKTNGQGSVTTNSSGSGHGSR
jgi:hypothetical protein